MGTHLALKAVCCSHFAPDFITHPFKGRGLRQNGEDRKSLIQKALEENNVYLGVLLLSRGCI